MKKIHFYSANNTMCDFLIIIKHLLLSLFIRKQKIDKNLNIVVSKFLGSNYNYFFLSGRMGLYSIINALGLSPDDEIIIPAFTCVAVPNAIMYANVKPIYVDISFKDFNIDAKKIEQKISKKTKAIYAQHTFGYRCNTKQLRDLANKYNLYLIEDSAHYLKKNQIANSLADVTYFSTDRSKILNTFMGGFISTNNLKIKELLDNYYCSVNEINIFLELRIYISFLFEIILLNKYIFVFGKYFHILLTKIRFIFFFRDELCTKLPLHYHFPSKMPYGIKELLIRQFSSVDYNLLHRKKVCYLLDKFFKKKSTDLSLLRYPVLVKDKKIIKLIFSEYDFNIWFTSIAEGRDKNFNEIHYTPGTCPNAEYVTKYIFNFPTHLHVDLNKLELKLKMYKNKLLNNLIVK